MTLVSRAVACLSTTNMRLVIIAGTVLVQQQLQCNVSHLTPDRRVVTQKATWPSLVGQKM